MRILLVSTLKRNVAKDVTASRSRIIYMLAKGLVEKGHDVTLLGTADSVIEGVKTIPVIAKSWVDLPPVENSYFQETASLVSLAQKMVALQDDFDVIHTHTYPDFFLPLMESQLHVPLVTTLHIQATDYIDDVTSRFTKTTFVALSKAHRSGFKKTKIDHIVYNGIDTDVFAYEAGKEDYLLWVGRLSKAKNADGTFFDPKGIRYAIALAQKTQSHLKLAGSVEDMTFFNMDVKPHLSEKIEWIGEVSSEQKMDRQEIVKLYQKAKVFLMPINWDEPFGMVMAEAMSCGTPVIGFDRGAVKEVIADGETGFVVPPQDGIEGLAEALEKIDTLTAENCRKRVEQYFSIPKMVEGYEGVYKKVQNKG